MRRLLLLTALLFFVFVGKTNCQTLQKFVGFFQEANYNRVIVDVPLDKKIQVVSYVIYAHSIGLSFDIFIAPSKTGVTTTKGNIVAAYKDIGSGTVLTESREDLCVGEIGEKLLLTNEDMQTGEFTLILRYYLK